MVKRASFKHMDCSVAQALEVVGEWWSLLIMRDVFLGITRFEDIQQRLGIARNVLTDRLQYLVAEGVLTRRQYSDRPPRHEYLLTESGRDLGPMIDALRAWGDRWRPSEGWCGVGCGVEGDGPDGAGSACARCEAVTPPPP